MNSPTPTIRLLLLPLLVSLVLGGYAKPTEGAVVSAGECCLAKVNACCGRACCEVPAPLQERPRSDQTTSSSDRPRDGKVSWSGVILRNAESGHIDRCDSSPAVPHSGSPSLIAQHVRLQI